MIHVRRARRMIGNPEIQDLTMPWFGQTIGEVLGWSYHPDWQHGTQVRATIDGREVGLADLDRVCPEQCWITVAPNIGLPAGVTLGHIIVFALASAAISFAINFAYSALVKPPRPKPIARGDEEQPSFSFDGIHTTSGPGFRVPIAFGEIELGGQIVSSHLYTVGFTEYLEQTIVLCEGRIEAIGDVTGGTRGETGVMGLIEGGYSGEFPANLRANGNTLSSSGTEIIARMGEIGQSPMAGFSHASTVYDVETLLIGRGDFAESGSLDADANRFAVRLSFPGGLFTVDNAGQAQPARDLEFNVWWRGANAQSKRTSFVVNKSPGNGGVFDYQLTIPPYRNSFAYTLPEIDFSSAGPFFVMVTRQTNISDPSRESSQFVYSKVTTKKDHEFAYPRRACVGLRLRASERLAGAQPEWRFRIKGKRVRVWDATHGFSDYLWELPASGSFSGIWTYPPGRNPAWVLMELLLMSAGLGGLGFTVSQIDLQSFRNWADYCDETITGPDGNEARHQCDIVFDGNTTAWDAILQICQAGRATAIQYGNTIKVKYAYRNAHGRGTNSVAARGGGSYNQPAMLFPTSSIDDFTLTYLNRQNRPTIFDFQILNRELDFEPDNIAVPDDVSLQLSGFTGLVPQYAKRQKMQVPGITRPSQAKREGNFMHAINRLCKTQVDFSVGIEGLAAEPGDIIGIQHDSARFFDQQNYGFRTAAASAAVSTLYLDAAITVPASPAWVAYVLNTSGGVTNVALTAGTYAAGDPITTSAAITCAKGVPVAVGVQLKTVKLYEVTTCGLANDLRRRISAIEWQPDAYADPSAGFQDWGSDLSGEDESAASTIPQASGLTVRAAERHGFHVVSWDRPEDYGSDPVRVYRRLHSGEDWALVAETRERSIEIEGFQPFTTQQIAVAIMDVNRAFQLPNQAATTTVTVPEFPDSDQPAVRDVEATQQGDGVLLTWKPVNHRGLLGYEVRRGSTWNGSVIVGRTNDPTLFIAPAPYGSQTYMVAARFDSGLYSGEIATTTINYTGAEWFTLFGSQTDLTPSQLGTTSGTTYDAGSDTVAITTGEFEGTYEGAVLDLGVDMDALWLVNYTVDEEETLTVADLTHTVGSGEARWRRVSGREATYAAPGADWETPVSELLTLIGDSDRRVAGPPGFVGSHTRCKIESRYEKAGVWSAYATHHNGWRTARKIQVRFTLSRWHSRYQTTLRAFSTAAMI